MIPMNKPGNSKKTAVIGSALVLVASALGLVTAHHVYCRKQKCLWAGVD